MLIYIRHADKDFRNGKSTLFKHDPGITDIGVKKAERITLKLIEEHGNPTQIISSPFRRARETSLVMNSVLKNSIEEIQIDNNLSEYLGNHNNTELDVTIATKIHNPPHPENYESMVKRVQNHIKKMKVYLNDHPKEVIWLITHGIVMNIIASSYGIKTNKQFPCLTCFSVIENTETIKAEFIIFKSSQQEDDDEISKIIESESESEKQQKNKPNKDVSKLERVLIPPKLEYTGRDDMTGRKK